MAVRVHTVVHTINYTHARAYTNACSQVYTCLCTGTHVCVCPPAFAHGYAHVYAHVYPQAFAVIDVEGDGCLSEAELVSALMPGSSKWQVPI